MPKWGSKSGWPIQVNCVCVGRRGYSEEQCNCINIHKSSLGLHFCHYYSHRCDHSVRELQCLFVYLCKNTRNSQKETSTAYTHRDEYWLYLHFCIIDLKLWPSTYLSSSLVSQRVIASVILSPRLSVISACLSALPPLPLPCLSSLTVHFFVSYRHSAVCFLLVCLWAAADSCRCSKLLQTSRRERKACLERSKGEWLAHPLLSCLYLSVFVGHILYT